MKKLTVLFCFIVCHYTFFAQTKFSDSLKTVLEKTTVPGERFSIINEILIEEDGFAGAGIDSSLILELLKIAQKEQNNAMLATSYNWIGYSFYRNIGDNTTALEYYFKALPLAEKAKDKRRISSLCFDIANVYAALKNQEEYITYVHRGGNNLPDRSSPKYDYMLVQYQRGMATHNLNINQLDSALFYGQAMEQTSNKLKSAPFQITAKNIVASIYAKMGEHDLAEIYFKKVNDAISSIRSETSKRYFYQTYIPYLLKTNRITEAKTMTDKMWNLSKQTNNLNFQLPAANFKSKIFEELQQTDSALFYSRAEAGINEQIFNQRNLNTIQALAFKEQLRIIEETEKEAKEKEKTRQQLEYIFITIGIITLIIFYLMLSRSFITNIKMIEYFGIVALLIVFEFLNLLLHPFLERLTDHSPVLMLLTLVCIAALLVPLHHKVEKWATVKLVEKNKRIRLASAKKTIQQLDTKAGDRSE